MHTNIPYHANPSDSHCSQACLRMGYEYFNPEKSWAWQELDELTGHKEGLTTWNMKAYIETAKMGYDVVVYDPLDYAEFVKRPKEYITEKFSPAYAEETFRLSDMEQAVADAKELLATQGLNLHARSYNLDEYKKLLDDGYLVATWVDGAVVYGKANKCWPHFILTHGYDDKGIIAHDPGGEDLINQQPNRHIAWDIFEKANKMNDKGERGEILAFRKNQGK